MCAVGKWCRLCALAGGGGTVLGLAARSHHGATPWQDMHAAWCAHAQPHACTLQHGVCVCVWLRARACVCASVCSSPYQRHGAIHAAPDALPPAPVRGSYRSALQRPGRRGSCACRARPSPLPRQGTAAPCQVAEAGCRCSVDGSKKLVIHKPFKTCCEQRNQVGQVDAGGWCR